MRSLIGAGLILGCMHCGVAGNILAADRVNSTRSHLKHEVPQRAAATAELIHQRAVFHARNRVARLESQRWQGVSSARPMIPQDAYGTNLNPGLSNGAGYPTPWFRGW